ncbi:hypothetical protein [Nitrospira sp. M1]
MMNRRCLRPWNLQHSPALMHETGSLVGRTVSCLLVVLLCVGIFGCSTPTEPTSEPSKEEIRNDADRFFEKMEQEKQGELKR